MKKSEILRSAKFHIQHNHNGFVCTAIMNGIRLADIGRTDRQHQFLVKWVEGLLDGSQTLNDWLCKNHDIESPLVAVATYTDKMRITRMAWLDWMISYWEARGD